MIVFLKVYENVFLKKRNNQSLENSYAGDKCANVKLNKRSTHTEVKPCIPDTASTITLLSFSNKAVMRQLVTILCAFVKH